MIKMVNTTVRILVKLPNQFYKLYTYLYNTSDRVFRVNLITNKNYRFKSSYKFKRLLTFKIIIHILLF